MTELVQVAHVGWRCRNRGCTAAFAFPTTGPANLDADRTVSRGKAEAEGWLFMPEWNSGKPPAPGANPSLHYCPGCAPVARARAELRAAEHSRRWNGR